MARLRFNFISGRLDEELNPGDETMVSEGLLELPSISSPDYLAIIFDPAELAGEPEIAYIIDHEEASDEALIMRGQEETEARMHTSSMQWVHGAVAKDFSQYYVHHQSVPSASWYIQHDLGGYPGITIVDSAGSVVEGDIQYNDNTSVTISFSAAFAGKAFLD